MFSFNSTIKDPVLVAGVLVRVSSNLADSCVAGEFVPPFLLPSQNTMTWRRAGVLGHCLMYIIH